MPELCLSVLVPFYCNNCRLLIARITISQLSIRLFSAIIDQFLVAYPWYTLVV